MKLQRSSGRPKKPRFIIRQVTGASMLPALRAGRIVIGSGRFRLLEEGDVIIFLHNGMEKIKRITSIDTHGRIFVQGDNSSQSIDSRHFGWLSEECVVAVLIWPRV